MALRVLLTNHALVHRAGSETSVQELACGLLERGHRPAVYSPLLGGVADALVAAGVPVVDDLDALPFEPELIHGQHFVQALTALLRFPQVPAVFACHGRLPWQEIPPLWAGIDHYLAVDRNTEERLVDVYGIPRKDVTVLLNWVDLERFPRRAPLPPRPSRALIFSNAGPADGHIEPVQQACAALGIPVETRGLGVGQVLEDPGAVLGSYDLVFAKAKSAQEALASGAAVVLCDSYGLGPMVTRAEVEELRPWNFGMRCLSRPVEVDSLVAEIQRYDAADAGEVCRWVRSVASRPAALDSYLELVQRVVAAHRPGPGPRDMLEDFLTRTARKLAAFEGCHRVPPGTRRMAPLPEDAGARLELRVLEAPRVVRLGQRFPVLVELENRGDETLCSLPPHPVQLAHRWLPARGWRCPPGDGERTRLPRALGPAGRLRCELQVETAGLSRTWLGRWLPGSARALLRVTLVQEGVRWFDSGGAPRAVDLSLEVVP